MRCLELWEGSLPSHLTMQIDLRDLRFFSEKGDPDFSPDHNKYVIDRSIEKYEAMRRAKQKEFDDQLGERVHAAASYLRHLNSKGTPIEKYFGKRTLAELQGKKILQTLQGESLLLDSLD